MLIDLDERFVDAVQAFWNARDRQQQRQIEGGKIDAGTRGAVTGGTQMGALEVLLADLIVDAGLDRAHIRVRTALELPGYYRPEKKWDLLVVVDGRLLLAMELKSQVGPSFGNNFNNRAEEAIGNAEDIWTAYREGRFGKYPAPFLGYLFLLEDCPDVRSPVQAKEPYFAVDPVFKGASYARRYEVLCDRLLLERKYSGACLVLSERASPDTVSFPSTSLSFRQFAAAIEGHVHTFLRGSEGQA
ncbi:MAG: PaeR7I family type II restriction endonuclease [Actinomycetota bacterium]